MLYKLSDEAVVKRLEVTGTNDTLAISYINLSKIDYVIVEHIQRGLFKKGSDDHTVLINSSADIKVYVPEEELEQILNLMNDKE